MPQDPRDPSSPSFPAARPRRLRRTPLLRDLAADVTLGPGDLIWPVFVRSFKGGETARPVASMPGVDQLAPELAVERIERLAGRGLRAVMLFGVTETGEKDGEGSAAWDEANPVHTTLRLLRDRAVPVVRIADLCFCEYTDHGHCGPLADDSDPAAGPTVANDATLPRLGRQAVSLVRNGAEMVAPSGMIDGMVGAIRSSLDEAGEPDVAVMSYAIKYASAFYGPFRDAGEGGMTSGDRRGYQMDVRRRDEWRRELAMDLAEGADGMIVKPAVTCLDVIRGVKHAAPEVPLAAYHVSGEYAMLHAAADRGWLDLRDTALESTLAIRRAGADRVISYFTPQLLDWLDA